jgi:hypothetical protein
MLRRCAAAALVVSAALSVTACGGEDDLDWEETTRTAGGEPAAGAPAKAGTVIDKLSSPPLAVGDRLRVSASRNRVVAQPVDAPADAAPHWSYERAGEHVDEVRVAQPPGRPAPLVLASWSDGGLVALDGYTGAVAWRAAFTPQSGDTVLSPGYRADTVTGYTAEGRLRAAGDVVLMAAATELAAFDAGDGRRLWQQALPTCERFAPVGAHVVIDVGCSDGPVTIRVLNARTGVETQKLVPPPWPKTEDSGQGDSLAVAGCRPDGADCTLISHSNGGGSDSRSRYWTMGDDGRLVPTPEGDRRPLSGDVQHASGDLEGIQVIDSPGDTRRWQREGELRDRAKRQYAGWSLDPVRPEDSVLWISSFSWEGGPPALVKLNAKNGKLLGCQPVPTGEPVTYLKSMDDKHLIVGTYTEEDAPDEGAFALVVPAVAKRCPR